MYYVLTTLKKWKALYKLFMALYNFFVLVCHKAFIHSIRYNNNNICSNYNIIFSFQKVCSTKNGRHNFCG